MHVDATPDLQARERALVDAIRAEHPERVERETSPDPDIILGRIGVTYLSHDRPRGYLRLFPHDFIVEEILTDGTVVPIASDATFVDNDDRRTLWADLVKANISWPHAMTDLRAAFGLEEGRIGYSGMKDAVAVTSQRLSLRGVTKEAADALDHDRMILRPIRYGSGALQPGDLKGNRFTIVVRSDEDAPIDELVRAHVEKGFLNFFGAQRFGNRLLAHRLGQKLLQNDIDGVLRAYFGEPGIFDVPLYRDMRLALTESYGDWDVMLEIAQNFPFTLRDETKVLLSLQREPGKTRAALATIKDQVKLWAYAYASWLINRRFSQMAESGIEPPRNIPLPLAENGPLPEYRDLMAQDDTSRYREALRLFPFVQTSNKTIPARIVPEGLRWKKIAAGFVMRFSLGKGAYATSCLSHVFRLYDGLPVPDWVKKEDMDALAELGEGSLDDIRKRFSSILIRRDVRTEEESTE